jgi:hypothetical protein
MPEFTLPLSSRDQDWIELRERFARAAREMHFTAVSNEAVDAAALLVVAGTLAKLALSIPMCPAHTAGLVDASTLLATQILQHGRRSDDDGIAVAER